MFDIWVGDLDLTSLILIFSAVILLPGQLLLCFKVKSRILRLLPLAVLSVTTAVLVIMAKAVNGWDGLGYLIIAIFTGSMALVCVVSWIIWAIVRLVQKIKQKNK